MSDFPPGWTLQAIATAGTAASITVPATAGVVHVLDSFNAKLVSLAAAAVAASSFVQVNTGGGLLSYALLAFNGGAIGSDESNLTGLDLATALGGALVVSFSTVAAANYDEILIIQGHDI